jgi:hypothetical protein
MLYILATSTCKKNQRARRSVQSRGRVADPEKDLGFQITLSIKKNNKKIFKPFRFRILNLSHEKNTYHEKNNNFLNKFNIVKNKTNIKNDFKNLIFKLRQCKPPNLEPDPNPESGSKTV